MSTVSRDMSRNHPLIEELIAAFVRAGKAVLPAGRRSDVIELLTQVVVEPDVYDAYIAELRAERERLGPEGKRRLLNASGPEVPWEQIRARGFDWLPDDVLADLATSPEALRVLDESQFDGQADIGKWFFDAILSGRSKRSSVPGAATTSDLSPSETASASTRPARRVQLIKFVLPVALAASLLLAFYLGTFWSRNDNRTEIRLASVSVRGDATRGIEDVALDVTNATDRRVFLSVVGLVPGRKTPAYYYRNEGRYIELPPGGRTEIKNLPPEFEGSSALILVSTEFPAGGVVRDVTPPTHAAATAEEVAEQIRNALNGLGLTAEVRVIPLPLKKR